jgi:hypothetical protein
MAQIDWYNDNENRAYPFVLETVDARPPAVPPTIEDLPNAAAVDAGFMMGLQSGFDAELHDVWLHELRREGDTFFLEFRSDAPGLFDRPLTFTRMVGDSDFSIEYVDNFQEPVTSLSVSESEIPGCDPEPLWSGFLVTGRIEALEALLPADGTVVRADDGGTIEPALITSLVNGYVDSFNLANNDRTRVDAPENCPPVTWPHPIDMIFVNEECMRGHVRIKPGYNALIRQSTSNNRITIAAGTGSGEGEPCEAVPLFDGESPPEGGDSSLLEGGPLCNEAIRSINGVGGRVLDVMGGPGVTVTPDPANNRLTLDVSMVGLSTCFESEQL